MEFKPQQTEKIATHRKEQHFKESYTLFEIENNVPKWVLELRIYQTSQSYAVVWVNWKYTGTERSATGVGKDLYRDNAAQHALYNAGFKGLPDDPTPQTNLEAIAAYLQVKNYFIHNAYA